MTWKNPLFDALYNFGDEPHHTSRVEELEEAIRAEIAAQIKAAMKPKYCPICAQRHSRPVLLFDGKCYECYSISLQR